jgi:hypothetical protein
MPDEDLVDGVERELEPMSAGELVPERLDAELALAAQARDQRLLPGEDLAVGRAVRPVAARLQTGHALGPVEDGESRRPTPWSYDSRTHGSRARASLLGPFILVVAGRLTWGWAGDPSIRSSTPGRERRAAAGKPRSRGFAVRRLAERRTLPLAVWPTHGAGCPGSIGLPDPTRPRPTDEAFLVGLAPAFAFSAPAAR